MGEADQGREKKKKKKKAGKRASKKRRNKKKKCRKGAKGKDCRKARKQAKKGGKSGKGGNAKKRRTNKKKCPKGKAGKDCRKAKRSKGKKSRSNGKGGKGGKKRNKGEARGKQASRQFTTCFEKMYKYTEKMKKANNIQKQFLRVNGSKGTISSKKDKKGSFNGTLSTLTTALGGNKTNPKCAASSRAFNSTLDTLDRCEADIEASCTFSVNDTRFAEIEQCYKDAESFYDQVEKC